jgi:hypothetical protein
MTSELAAAQVYFLLGHSWKVRILELDIAALCVAD